MQNEFYNQPAADWAKQNLENTVEIKLKFGSRIGKIFTYLLLFSVPLAFLTLGVVLTVLRGFDMDAYRSLACGVVLCIPFGIIAGLGWYMQGKFVKTLESGGATGSLGRKYSWGKLYYVDHVSKYVRRRGLIRDNQLELVFENAKLIIPPLIYHREQIWNLINTMPVQVRDDGKIREIPPANENKAPASMDELIKMIEALPRQTGSEKK